MLAGADMEQEKHCQHPLPASSTQHQSCTNFTLENCHDKEDLNSCTNKDQQEIYQNKEFKNEKVSVDNRSCTPEDMMSDEYEDDCDEDDETEDVCQLALEEMRYSDVRMGTCSMCHFAVRGIDACKEDYEKALLCSEGHLLCCKCVQRFGIQSETSCVLCAATESEQTLKNASETSSAKSRDYSKCRGEPMEPCRNIVSRYNRQTSSCSDDKNWNNNDTDEEIEDKVFPPDFGQHSYCSVVDSMKSSSINMKSQISSQMMVESSRRPIQCPRLDCAVNVAFSALANHFIFDHPEIPILTVSPDEKITLIINFDGLDYDSSHCLALLLVSDKLTGSAARHFNCNNVNPQYKNRLPLPVLAARLRYKGINRIISAAGDGIQEAGGNVIIVWVAGLDIGNSTTRALQCSIQAIDSIESESFRSLTYAGPINSLRTAQKPRDVLLAGDCVILHDGFINHITNGCQSLNVNVTIH